MREWEEKRGGGEGVQPGVGEELYPSGFFISKKSRIRPGFLYARREELGGNGRNGKSEKREKAEKEGMD